MKHLTDFERQFIAKAAFDWYTQHGYNAELSYYHGMGRYSLTICLRDGEVLSEFPFLQHPDITKNEVPGGISGTLVCFDIPYGVKL